MKPFRGNPLAWVLGLSFVFFVLFISIASYLFLGRSGGHMEERDGARKAGVFHRSSGAVGVLEIDGVIMDSKRAVRDLKRFEREDEVKAVVVRLDSPGGAVGPSQEIYHLVQEFKKPIVASMGSIAASGAFYVAMGADQVFANAGTLTGSIGVIMQMTDLTKLFEFAKIKPYAIKTGKYKDAGAPYREMGTEERELLQEMIDTVLKQFEAAVADGRKMRIDDVAKVADGRIFSGEQAQKLGLVDTLGGLEDAIHAAADLGGIKDEDPRVVYPYEDRSSGLLKLLLSGGEEEESRFGGGDAPDGLTEARMLVSKILGSGRLNSVFSPGMYLIWNGSGL